MKILVCGNTVLAASSAFTVRTSQVQSAEGIWPKDTMPGWQIVDGELPNGLRPGDCKYENGQFVRAFDPPPPSIDEYVAAMEQLYDEKAKERNYDSRFTCALRAAYPSPFQAEGIAFGTWMDTCNAIAYQVMAAVKAGERSFPTIAELLAELPPFDWGTP